MPWTILGLAVAALLALNVLVVVVIGTASQLQERRGDSHEDSEFGSLGRRSDLPA